MEPTSKGTRQPGGLLILLAAMLVIGTGAGIWLWWAGRERPPRERVAEPGPATPSEKQLDANTIEQFYVGLAALDIEENQRAGEIFQKLSETIPSEPAVWANLAIAKLRLNQGEQAQSAVSKAAELADQSDAIRMLQAIVAERTGEFDRAIRLLKGLSNPDAAALYMQSELVGRTGQEAANRERLELINRILEHQPDNLVAQFEGARLAAKLEDREQLKRYLDVISQSRQSWTEQQSQMFDSAQQAVEGGEFLEAARYLAFLQNLSKQSPKYQASVAALGITGSSIGNPVRKFLNLPEPDVIVAEADMALTFEMRPVQQQNTAVRPDLFLAFPLSGERGSTLLSLTGNVLQVGTTAALPFPRPETGGAVKRHAVLPADLNSDFRQDLVLVGPTGTLIYLQGDKGQFTPFGPEEKEQEVFKQPGEAAWGIDFELDGDLDLLIARPAGPPQLIRNNGDMTFTALDALNHLPAPQELGWVDLDEDGDVDVALLDRQGRVLVSWNQRAGRYTEPQPVSSTPAVALAVGDVNRDGRFDVVTLGDSGVVHRHSFDSDTSQWQSGELAEWAKAPDLKAAFTRDGTTLSLADVDNNGAMDLIASAEASTSIWLGGAADSFQKLELAPPMLVTSVLDFDGNGRLDLIGLTQAGGAMAKPLGTKKYGWHTILPRANPLAGDKRINSFGLGGTIQIRTGRLLQAAPMTSPVVHFGLGTHAKAVVARFVWPNGTVQAEFDLNSGEAAVANQRLKGSCPWIFALGDDGLQFVKDFIWRSPLGLKINSQETAGVNQTEDWVKIPGKFLSRQDGNYELRITAELWETHFFDHISLLVVDHPQEVDIFVDERFVATRSPELRVMAAAPPQPLKTVHDASGSDVSVDVNAIDGIYVDSFPLGTYQGIAPEHWVEFELPDGIPAESEVSLIGHGWIYPTDSSLNVAVSQGNTPSPHGLILEAVDAEGNWSVLSGDLGFPAGKNKTVVIPLPKDLLRGGLRRFRLRTNLEVYWDYLAWTTERPNAVLKTVREEAAVAQLRYRGFSELSPLDRRKPDIPDYNQLSGTGQRWRDLEGYYTRFGDVRELLHAVDDRYVIMNAGDEFVLRFSAPKGPPEGWRRDFVLIGDGWVKDGDYNTMHSRTVHPLPSHNDSDYSTPAVPLVDDPVYRQHQDDWFHFHTRYITPRRFELGLMGGKNER